MTFEFPILNDNVYSLPFYIQELGFLENQDHVIRDKNYDNNQLLICTGGSGKLNVDGNSYTITENNIFFTRKKIAHEYFATSEPWTIHWIVFDGTSLNELLTQLNIESHEVFDLGNTSAFSNIFDDALTMLQSNNPKKHIECSILIYQLLTKLSYCNRMNTPRDLKSKQEKTYDMVLTYLEDHYASDLSLTDISDALNLSTYYISRVFKTYNQSGLITYLNQYRVSMAKKYLLQSPSDPIKNIAVQTGFKNASYFSSTFKKSEGMTPLEFRQLHGV